MIIDSHAHYAHRSYTGEFRYLTVAEEGFAIASGSRERVLQELKNQDIRGAIEPGIGLESNREILALCREHPGFLFPAVGVHPTRTFRENWKDHRQLEALSREPGVIAIGETGLDYHYAREEQHRLCQTGWFLYQLSLAYRRKLPLILHIRDADEDALGILRLYPGRKYGGVVHCFNRGWDVAEQYLKLGFHLGIGGSLLQLPERAESLWEAVRRAPLERLLLETDAPYILPYCKDTLPPKQLRRCRNTSLILPKVAEKIAELKGIDPETVISQTTENTIRLFSLSKE